MIPGCFSRVLRAAVFAAVCVPLAALGHVMMSGDILSRWAPVLGFAVTGAAGWCLTGRERGVPLVTAVALVAQAALHTAFSLAPPAGGGAMDGMEHMGSGPGHGSDAGMLAAHLAAALLCGLWLAHGERAGFRVLRAVAGWLTAPLRWPAERPVPPSPPRTGVRGRSQPGPRPFLLVHAITSRGPPARTAVVPRRPEPYGAFPSSREGSTAMPPAPTSAPDTKTGKHTSPRNHTKSARHGTHRRAHKDTPADETTTALALAARHGDTGAVEQLVRALHRDVLRYVAHLCADPQAVDDLAQDTFLRALGSLHRFEGRCSARAWLLSIARRAVMDSYRYAATRPRLADLPDWRPVVELAQPRGLPGFDDGIVLRELLQALPADRREAFVLTQLLGLPYEEAARVSDCPVGTVRSRVARARAALAEQITP